MRNDHAGREADLVSTTTGQNVRTLEYMFPDYHYHQLAQQVQLYIAGSEPHRSRTRRLVLGPGCIVIEHFLPVVLPGATESRLGRWLRFRFDLVEDA